MIGLVTAGVTLGVAHLVAGTVSSAREVLLPASAGSIGTAPDFAYVVAMG